MTAVLIFKAIKHDNKKFEVFFNNVLHRIRLFFNRSESKKKWSFSIVSCRQCYKFCLLRILRNTISILQHIHQQKQETNKNIPNCKDNKVMLLNFSFNHHVFSNYEQLNYTKFKESTNTKGPFSLYQTP